ncbi:MAG: metallophosphoesterase [Oscillospiraceae bacterium]|nr:metallophosphoesterase [Oscillospiraceae bacterium]MBQ8807302.1 metallophosphoesterase [Bacteroidaceae bacterium]
MPAKKRKSIILTVVAAILFALIAWIIWGNTALELNTYTISSSKLPQSFDGYRIAHVSDLHNAEMGKNNEKLLIMLRDADPDMIAITGDLVDSRNTDIEVALQFVREAVKIAPCYYVTGNHEARISEYDELKEAMEAADVTVLEDAQTEISLTGEFITLIGVNDPSYQTDYLFGDSETVMNTKLEELHTENDGFTILLSHRPELFDTYADHDIDLILSGHAHGGQFRLPFVGGLVAPNQGFFPEYDAGLFSMNHTNMIVSRGIGNSILPFRFNNRPEVIIIELKK